MSIINIIKFDNMTQAGFSIAILFNKLFDNKWTVFSGNNYSMQISDRKVVSHLLAD